VRYVWGVVFISISISTKNSSCNAHDAQTTVVPLAASTGAFVSSTYCTTLPPTRHDSALNHSALDSLLQENRTSHPDVALFCSTSHACNVVPETKSSLGFHTLLHPSIRSTFSETLPTRRFLLHVPNKWGAWGVQVDILLDRKLGWVCSDKPVGLLDEHAFAGYRGKHGIAWMGCGKMTDGANMACSACAETSTDIGYYTHVLERWTSKIPSPVIMETAKSTQIYCKQ